MNSRGSRHVRRRSGSLDAARLALEAAGIGTWDERLSSGAIDWSPRARRIFGVGDRDTIDFETFVSLVHPEDRERTQLRLQAAVKVGGSGETVSFRIVRPDGVRRWVELRPLSIPENGDLRLVAAVADVTEERRERGGALAAARVVENRLRDQSANQALLDEELDTFADSAAHDLRGPLRRIAAYVDSLLASGASLSEAEARARLGSVVASCRRMNALIDDLLLLARTSRRELFLEDVDLSAVAAEEAGVLARAEPGRRVRFEAQAGLVARGDRVLLRAALRGLLDNAWKFTASRKTARVSFSAEKKEGETVYRLSDNGIGFDMAYAEKMFRPFERIHPAGTFSGSGVGLAIVERVIRRHRGRVWSSGRPGAGATFYFTLFTEDR